MERIRRIGRGLLTAGVVVAGVVVLLVVLNVVTTLVQIIQSVVLVGVLLGLVYVAYELYTGWTREPQPAEEFDLDEHPADSDLADEDFQREVDEELAALSRDVGGSDAETETDTE